MRSLEVQVSASFLTLYNSFPNVLYNAMLYQLESDVAEYKCTLKLH